MRLKRMRIWTLMAVACVALSGCATGAPTASTGAQDRKSEASKPQQKTVSYDFGDLALDVPDYWKADTEMSEAGTTLIFRSEDKDAALSIRKDDIPQFMTVKAQGDDIVPASDEEIADGYFFTIMDENQEQTVGEMESVDCGDYSYWRKTYRGTANINEVGEIKTAQRTAVVLLNDNSSSIQILVYCPEDQDERLNDVDALMESIIDQLS